MISSTTCAEATTDRHATAARIGRNFFIGFDGPPRFLGLRANDGLRPMRYFTPLWRFRGRKGLTLPGYQAVRIMASAVRSSHNGRSPPKSLTEFKIVEQRSFAEVRVAFWRKPLTRARPKSSSEELLLRPSQVTTPRETRSRAAPFSNPTIRESAVA